MNIGIDIGGSHIGIGLVSNLGIIEKKQEAYIIEKDSERIITFIESFVIDTLKSWKKEGVSFDKIGIAMPGVVVDDIVKFCVNMGIENYDLKSVILKEFPECGIHIKNDAKCAALAEKNLGAIREYSDAVFMCLGTGIGGAAFYNGNLVVPRRSSGFEFGHTIIKKDGEQCKCGSKGCFEIYGSMKSFKCKMRSVLNLAETIDGQELLNAVVSNLDNKIVEETIENYIDDLCVGISNIVNILEPEAICIGGGFSEYKSILLDRLENKLHGCDYVFYKQNLPRILIAELGNDAGIIGSALFI